MVVKNTSVASKAPKNHSSYFFFAMHYPKMISRLLKLLLNPVNGDNFKIRVLLPRKYHFMPTLAHDKTLAPGELVVMPLTQGLNCSCREYNEVSGIFNTDLSKKMYFSKRAKMECFMEVGSGINHNLKLRKLSSNTAKICACSSV